MWVFTRIGNDWVQQGSKLVGSDGIDASAQGSSVAISSDGNTVITGGPGDFLNEGAAWVFTRSNGAWSQQGPKLYAESSTSPILVGKSVSISGDDNTAMVASPGANGSIGQVWVFTRSAGVWTKESSSFIGTGAEGAARQGWSVALSSEGSVIESGPYDNNGAGSVWFFHNPSLGIPQGPDLALLSRLEQNFPNPFNQNTLVKFQISSLSDTRVNVYDTMGRIVSTLVNARLNPGSYEVNFDSSNFPGGTYFYSLETGGITETKKMIVLK